MESASPREEEAVLPGQERWTAWFSRHRLVTLALLVYIIIDKASQMNSLMAEMCGSDSRRSFGEEAHFSFKDSQPLWGQQVDSPLVEPARRLSESPKRTLPRILDSSSSSVATASSTDTTSSSATGHTSHPHEAMFFLISALLVGCMLTHMMTMPLFEGMQQSVALFITGLIYSLLQEGLHLSDHLGPLGRSYIMWMEIDPHLLLFTLLPPLVTGDAMTIDTSVARRVAMQCMFLAGPGVCINGFMTAGFLYVYLPYNWSFLLCLVTGAILCATDPVAVVALLKELGASPTLTVQIQGESLLNDGTAIVLYTIAYNMLKGEAYDVGDIIQFLVKMAIYAWGLGMIIGLCFFYWIRAANNKLDPHRCSVIQVALTICCAYSSFIVAEGAFHISGVLATVASALVLAQKMWPQVVEKESMHTVWHMLEYLGNTVIFFLAGALTGKTMLRIQFSDYVHLFVIYMASTFLRGCLFFTSRPFLTMLSPTAAKQEVSVADALVMTWGGLRGAIGLALAIQVQVDKAGNKVSSENADRVLFYVSGVASLTLMVNASTCPALVKWLGITQLPATKRKMLQIINRQLLMMSMEQTQSSAVQSEIRSMLSQVETNIGINTPHPLRQKVSQIDPECHMRVSLQKEDMIQEGLAIEKMPTKGMVEVPMRDPAMAQISMVTLQAGHIIVHEVKTQKEKIRGMDRKDLYQLSELPALPLMDQEASMYSLASTYMTDPAIQRAVNEAFLSLVRSQYWKMIERGDFVSFTHEAEHLLTSVTLAFSQTHYDLCDWSFIEPFITFSFEKSKGRMSTAIEAHKERSAVKIVTDGWLKILWSIINSTVFSACISVTIAANTIYIYVEQEAREDSDNHIKWLVIEIIFQTIFTLEFVLKFACMKMAYFKIAWNLFDFFLVILGLIGTVVSIVVQQFMSSSASIKGSEAQLVRAAQIFRMMRIARLFRLLRFWQVVKAKLLRTHVSLKVAEHMQKTAILTSFIKAHVASMHLMVKYFGRHGEVDTVEVARCILQSQVSVYKSMLLLCHQRRKLDTRILEAAKIAQESKAIAEELEAFVLEAHHGGVINHIEAESILVPIHDHVREFIKTIGDSRKGRISFRIETDGLASDSESLGEEFGCGKSFDHLLVVKQLANLGVEDCTTVEFGEIGAELGRKSAVGQESRKSRMSRKSTKDVKEQFPQTDHEPAASALGVGDEAPKSIMRNSHKKKKSHHGHIGFAMDEGALQAASDETTPLVNSATSLSLGAADEIAMGTTESGSPQDSSSWTDAQYAQKSMVRHPGRLGAFQTNQASPTTICPAAPPPALPPASGSRTEESFRSARMDSPAEFVLDSPDIVNGPDPRLAQSNSPPAPYAAKQSLTSEIAMASEPAQEEPAPEPWREGSLEPSQRSGDATSLLEPDLDNANRSNSSAAGPADGGQQPRTIRKVIRKKPKKSINTYSRGVSSLLDNSPDRDEDTTSRSLLVDDSSPSQGDVAARLPSHTLDHGSPGSMMRPTEPRVPEEVLQAQAVPRATASPGPKQGSPAPGSGRKPVGSPGSLREDARAVPKVAAARRSRGSPSRASGSGPARQAGVAPAR